MAKRKKHNLVTNIECTKSKNNTNYNNNKKEDLVQKKKKKPDIEVEVKAPCRREKKKSRIKQEL